MKTTLDLPDDLYRTIKAAAALRGMSVRELVTGYLARGLAADAQRESERRERAPLPTFRTGGPPVPLTNRDIDALLAADDLSRLRVPTAGLDARADAEHG